MYALHKCQAQAMTDMLLQTLIQEASTYKDVKLTNLFRNLSKFFISTSFSKSGSETQRKAFLPKYSLQQKYTYSMKGLKMTSELRISVELN